MADLEVIEAKVPARAVRIERPEEEPTLRFAPLAGILGGPIFTRTRDIIAANVNELLDRSEDPARMIRMIIVEMEETLVEIRATAARSIADIKEMRRATDRLEQIQANWQDKAELALEKDREDLARAALAEKQKAADMADGLIAEIAGIEAVLRGYEADIAKLQAKLAEARSRQASIASRIESAMTRARTREMLHGSRTEDAFARFDLLERRADLAEGYAEALALAADKVDAELEQLKAALAAKN
jgi:phage shock protein A